MSRRVFLFFAFLLLPFSNLQGKPTIAVVDFTANAATESEASALTDRLRTELVETGKWKVVEREMMNVLLAEQGFQMSGCVSDECIVATGRILGADKMIAGSIVNADSIYTVSAKIVDVQTGKTIRTVELNQNEMEELFKSGMGNVARMLSEEQEADLQKEFTQSNSEESVDKQSDDIVPHERQPKVVKSVEPKYPKSARRKLSEVKVWIKVLVDESGKVMDAKVAKPSGVDTAFEEAAIKAAWQYIYSPAIAEGKPVKVWVMYPVVFKK